MKRLFHKRRVSVSLVLLDAAALLTLFVVILLLQWASGAHSAAFGAEPDEASHYVTSVMIRDYVAHGLPGNPITFAKDFYVHYPRVAFGLWPPLFHLVSGLWMLAFGTNRTSVMFLLAALTTAWAFAFYRISRPLLGTSGAALSALLLVLLPTTQKSTSEVMLDIALAVTMLLAMGAYARYLETERTIDGFVFGFFAAAAFLVKYDAIALALVPPLCVVITGRYYLWRSRNFWLPVAVVVVVAGPWYVIMRRLVLYAAEPGAEWPPLGRTLAANAYGIIFVAGPVVFVLALVGILVRLNTTRRPQIVNSEQPLYVVCAAVVLAVFLFHGAIYPIYEPRYLLPAAPALIFLSWSSLRYMHSLLGNRRSLAIATVVIVLVLQVVTTFVVPAKKTSGYVKATEEVLACGIPDNGAVLVSADPAGEGMLTAEFVMHDRRPNHYVVRASKVLASQTLMQDKYKLRYNSPQEIMTALDSIPIAIVVIQQCPPGQCGEHQNVLTETAARYSERWRLSSIVPSEAGSPILIYRIIGNEGKAVQTLKIDMTYTLGTTVEKQ